MKKNILEELLEKLRSNKNPSEKETQLAKLLEMRQSQMGLRPSDNEAADAVKESLAAVLLSSGNPSGEDVGPFMNKAIAEIAEDHDAKVAQLPIAWAVAKGTLPIIGATKVHHVEDAAEAVNIELSDDEIKTMEELADKADVNVIRVWEKEMK